MQAVTLLRGARHEVLPLVPGVARVSFKPSNSYAVCASLVRTLTALALLPLAPSLCTRSVGPAATAAVDPSIEQLKQHVQVNGGR